MATITPDQAMQVAHLPKLGGRLHLAQCLQWNSSEFDDDEVNMRSAIHLDYMYDSLEFATSRGFPWVQVCVVLQLAEELLQKTAQKDVEIDQVIQIYKDIVINYSNRISEKNLKIYTDYVFSTLVAHYRLYQYVFTRPRQAQLKQLDLDVNIPPEVLPLQDGKPFHIWQYEQKFEALEEEESTRINILKAQKQALLEEKETMDQAVLKNVVEPAASLPNEDLTKLIKNMAQEQVLQTEKILQTDVEEKHEDLEYYLQKTSLPRPAALGPPPRTKEPPTLSAKSKAKSGKLKSVKM